MTDPLELARPAAAWLPRVPWNGMWALDAFCCQGGAGMGLYLAGYRVVGVDLDPQPRYPLAFVQGDAVAFTEQFGRRFHRAHASPPCQLYSLTQRIWDRDHPDLIGPAREALEGSGVPYAIENVERARPELRDPVVLCGTMFGLRTYRHRLVEFGGGAHADQPHHPGHDAQNTKMGRPIREGTHYHAVGHFSGVSQVKADMGVQWMDREGISECIPPAYGQWIGRRLLAADREAVG
jgi:DNA (cytosine-5)-methyltransferase 1